nr:immunoglobulin light chain junction region [Macaca mulatta]MOW05414.1 immunoglobulin light chain junction region [Macaca mulatta]MOW05818.1 immunoglobulin light chain junction region [Macaca mulatta]MOW06638.1 immunoglobulin light chain junction region [Macaca mulatta]MOW07014.1 immunoglobulin light chain junction region [Macaca mulatta]
DYYCQSYDSTLSAGLF